MGYWSLWEACMSICTTERNSTICSFYFVAEPKKWEQYEKNDVKSLLSRLVENQCHVWILQNFTRQCLSFPHKNFIRLCLIKKKSRTSFDCVYKVQVLQKSFIRQSPLILHKNFIWLSCKIFGTLLDFLWIIGRTSLVFVYEVFRRASFDYVYVKICKNIREII